MLVSYRVYRHQKRGLEKVLLYCDTVFSNCCGLSASADSGFGQGDSDTQLVTIDATSNVIMLTGLCPWWIIRSGAGKADLCDTYERWPVKLVTQ